MGIKNPKEGISAPQSAQTSAEAPSVTSETTKPAIKGTKKTGNKAPGYDPNPSTYLFITDKIDINTVISYSKDPIWSKSVHRDKIYYIISTIFYSYFYDKTILKQKDGFVRLSWDSLAGIIGTRWVTRCLELLEKSGVIEISRFFKVTDLKGEGFCRSYKIAEAYHGKPRRIKINSKAIARRLKAHRESHLKAAVEAFELQPFVLNMLNRLSFTPEADEIMNACHFEGWEEALAFAHAYHAVTEREWFLTWDKRTGRIFNPLSNMPKMLRSCLLIDNEPTVELDIKNSQPLLLATLYPHASPERLRFLSVVQGGRFYEVLQTASGLTNVSRDEFKRLILAHAIYGYECYNDNIENGFRALFPELWELLWKAKEKGNTEFALSMQRLEAECMIHGVLKEVSMMAEPIPLLTIHDGAITTTEHVAALNQLILKHVQQKSGLTPMVQIKPSKGTVAA